MTVNEKTVVRLDDVQARYNGHIYSLVAEEEVQNGFVGIAGNLKEGEREVRSFDKPATANLATARAVLVDHSEIVNDESSRANNNLKNFAINAGTIFRAYELHTDDVFSISDNAIDTLATDAVVGNYVVLQDGAYKLKEADGTGIADHAFVGRIEEVSTIGRTYITGEPGLIAGGVIKFVAIRVVKNG